MAGAFKAFYENQAMLPPANKAKWIILLSADLHNADLMKAYHDEVNAAVTNSEAADGVALPSLVTPDKFAESHEVFEQMLQKKGMKSKLVASRKDMCTELLRRKPDAFSARLTEKSEKNTTIEMFMRELTKYPITDLDDISFIQTQFLLLETNFASTAKAAAENATKRMTFQDKLRYILIFVHEEEVLTAYLGHTDGLNREQLDSQGSDKADKGWIELHCECFNDPEKVYTTKANPNLHDRFKEEIFCEKGAYELTPDKSKTIMQTNKSHLRTMIKNYNASGNGSDMAKHDCDEDGMGGEEESQENFGRFNRELAKKRAELKGQDDLLLVDGDDRSSFLVMNTVDLLYWWDVMDELEMIFVFMGKLHDGVNSSSDKTPGATARRRVGNDANSNSQSNKKSKTGSKDDIQREMVKNVGRINNTLNIATAAILRQRISDAKDKMYQIEDALDELDKVADERKYQRNVRRLEELQKDIDSYELQLSDLEESEDAQPRELTYQAASV